MADVFEREFGWEDEIENDGAEFILLPEGDYPFEVVDFERGRHAGSEKLPPCNKAIIHIRVDGQIALKHNLFLHSKTEGILCSFFTAIGQRKKGEKLKMNWNLVVGSKGKLKLGIREYVGDDGQKRQYNEIKKFYEPFIPESFTEIPNTAGFEAGRF